MDGQTSFEAQQLASMTREHNILLDQIAGIDFDMLKNGRAECEEIMRDCANMIELEQKKNREWATGVANKLMVASKSLEEREKDLESRESAFNSIKGDLEKLVVAQSEEIDRLNEEVRRMSDVCDATD